jgi:hypothetical protein
LNRTATRFFALLAGPLILASACKGPATFKEEKFRGFTMKVADFLTPGKNPEVKALAFYEDTLNNCVFTVVRESKDSMIAYGQKYDLYKYFDKTYASLAGKMDNRELLLKNDPESYADTINGNRAVVSRLPGKIGEEELIYFLTIIETKQAFYQVIFGMPSDQEARYTKPMHEMIDSFREL